jgi:hypothetical protein
MVSPLSTRYQSNSITIMVVILIGLHPLAVGVTREVLSSILMHFQIVFLS